MLENCKHINRIIPISYEHTYYLAFGISFFYILIIFFQVIFRPIFFENNIKTILWFNITCASLSLSSFFWILKAKKLLDYIKKVANEDKLSSVDISKWESRSRAYKRRFDILFHGFIPISFIFAFTALFQTFVKSNDLGIITARYSNALFFFTLFHFSSALIIMISRISDLLYETKIKFDLKYSDIHGNTKPISSFFNAGLIISVLWIILSIQILYSKNTLMIESAYNRLYFCLCTFSFIMALFSFLVTIIPYRSFIRSFSKEKILLLDELKKQNTMESLYLYYKIMSKKFITLYDSILLPIKILILPTILTYIRQLILNSEDIDFYMERFMKILG